MSIRGHGFRTLFGQETAYYQDSLSMVLFMKCEACNTFDTTTAQIKEPYLPVALRTVFFQSRHAPQYFIFSVSAP